MSKFMHFELLYFRLRSQTPMSHTASKPRFAMPSHSVAGTEARSIAVFHFRFRSESHTQVLIS
jgi:hypothetical protein